MQTPIDTVAILRRTLALAQASPLPGLLALLALIVVHFSGRISPDSGNWISLSDIAGIAANYLVVTMVMRRAGLVEPGGASLRPLHFLALWLLTGIPILLGLFLLVLPGLYLWSRWVMTVPLVLGGGRPVLAAIGESWRRTRSIAAPISAAIVLAMAGWIAATAINFNLRQEMSHAMLGLSTALGQASIILTWYVSIAVVALIRRNEPDLEQVFA